MSTPAPLTGNQDAPPPLPPLVVELEGVLVRTNTLHEGLLRLLKHKPWLVLAVVLWSLEGQAFLRAEVARRVELDVARLPYDEALLARLGEERARGRPRVLVTRADQKVAEAVAAHLGLFDAVHASDGQRELSGERREARLREVLSGAHEEARRSPPPGPHPGRCSRRCGCTSGPRTCSSSCRCSPRTRA